MQDQNAKGWPGGPALGLVEMAGIEPASETFERRYATSLSAALLFRPPVGQRQPTAGGLTDYPGGSLALGQAYRCLPGCTSAVYDGWLTACEKHCEGRPDPWAGGVASFA